MESSARSPLQRSVHQVEFFILFCHFFLLLFHIFLLFDYFGESTYLIVVYHFQRQSIRLTDATGAATGAEDESWVPTAEWVRSWKSKLPLQNIMRLLQILVPQVEKICIDKYVYFN